MSTVNKIILVGYLGANPELRYLPDGQPLCTLSLATNHVYLDKEKQKQEKVNWHRITVWGRQGEICKEHLSKGRQVYVEGRLENRTYTDKDGKQQHRNQIVGQSIVFLGRASQEREPDDRAALSGFPDETQSTPEMDTLPF